MPKLFRFWFEFIKKILPLHNQIGLKSCGDSLWSDGPAALFRLTTAAAGAWVVASDVFPAS